MREKMEIDARAPKQEDACTSEDPLPSMITSATLYDPPLVENENKYYTRP
jgi:hypothetical protein